MGVYARILRTPPIGPLILATTITRLPFAINTLAIVLFLRAETGSFAIAGLVVGMLQLGSAAGVPFAGRLVDRRGAGMLGPLAVVHAVALLAIWALGDGGAPVIALCAVALLAGASFPPSGALLRSRWPELLPEPELLRGAYALDSVMIEVSFISGPLITAAFVVFAGPEFALGASAILILAGTAWFLLALPGDHGPVAAAARVRGFLGPLADPAIRMIALTTLPAGFCIGTIEVALPAFSEGHGGGELAGLLLALLSVASALGGLAFGVFAPRRGLASTFAAIAVLFPLACLPLAAASSPLAMAVLVMVAGVPFAPLIASRNELVGMIAERATGTEAFTWLLTALVAGVAAGAAVGGAVIEAQGWPAAVLTGCAVGALGAAVAVAGRDLLRPGGAASYSDQPRRRYAEVSERGEGA